MGKSIVILDKEFGSRRFACSNIEPDKDIIKYVNIRKTPKFIISSFLDDVREAMGIPEWFLTIDTRKTKTLHNGICIQLFLHFKGPAASTLEQDFSRLLSTGQLESPSIYIPGYVPSTRRKSKIQYKLCGSDVENGKGLLAGGNRFVPSGTPRLHSPYHIVVMLAQLMYCQLFI